MTEPNHERDRELEFHLEMLTRRYVDEGLDPEAARAKALARMGDLRSVGRDHRIHVGWWDACRQDLWHAWRVLRRSPGFVGLSVVMLALGTGASTAVFSVVDGALLRSPFVDVHRVAYLRARRQDGRLTSAVPREAYDRLAAAPPSVIAAMGPFTIGSPIVTGVDTPRRTRTECVSASMATVLGTRPQMGRWFGQEEDQPGAPGVALVSAKFWRGTLRGDPEVLGRTIRLDDQPATIIGVMPPGFDGPNSSINRDIWVPIGQSTATVPRYGCRAPGAFVNALVRLSPNVTMEEGSAALNATTDSGLALTPLTEGTTADLRDPFIALIGAVIAVLLIAFANVTNLGLERLAGRRQELSIRVALGATRGRIIRETVAEHLVISLAGAIAGIAIAVVTFDAMMALLPVSLPNRDAITLNGRVLSASVGLALLGGLCAGVMAAYRASADSIRAGLSSSDRGHTRSSTITRKVLVASELALGVLLLVGALLMIRTFLTLRPSAPGFEPAGKHIALVRLPPETPRAERLSFVRAVSEHLLAVPGVRDVAATTSVPMRRSVAVLPAAIGDTTADVFTGAVTPNYFNMMAIPVRRGRGIAERDTADAAPAAVVNEAFVRRWFPDSQPLGSTVTLSPDTSQSATFTIVGIVADTRSFGSDTRIRPFLYVPLAQSPLGNAFFMIHADERAGPTLPSAVRDVVTRLRPGQLVDEVEVLLDEMTAEVAQPRLGAWLFGLFAGLAVLLGGVGLAATLAWSVAQRRREIGIRMALGAQPGDVRRLIVAQMLGLSLTGIAAGLVAASLSTGLLEGWLYGVTPLDATTFGLCAGLMLAVSAVAAYLPARRATRVDPLIALRAD
jgi:putative ABC transport system permease protein